jgi:hypothetical protein
MNTNPNIVTAEVALEVQCLRVTLQFSIEVADQQVLFEEFEPDVFFLQAKLPVVLGALAPEMLHPLLQSVAQRLRDAHRHEFASSHGLLKTPGNPVQDDSSTVGQS